MLKYYAFSQVKIAPTKVGLGRTNLVFNLGDAAWLINEDGKSFFVLVSVIYCVAFKLKNLKDLRNLNEISKKRPS